MEFPTLVYRDGGPHQRPGGTFDYRPVNDKQQLQAALAEGWHCSVPEAIEAGRKPAPEPAAQVAPDQSPPQNSGPPDRQALEAQAKQLGIRFDGRTTDRKLAEAIVKAQG